MVTSRAAVTLGALLLPETAAVVHLSINQMSLDEVDRLETQRACRERTPAGNNIFSAAFNIGRALRGEEENTATTTMSPAAEMTEHIRQQLCLHWDYLKWLRAVTLCVSVALLFVIFTCGDPKLARPAAKSRKGICKQSSVWRDLSRGGVEVVYFTRC